MRDDQPRREIPLEPPAVAARPVLFTVVGFLAFVALSLGGLRLYYGWEVHGPVTQPPRAFAEPQLQSDPAGDLSRFVAEQRARLSGYAWADRQKGIVRIPIERAMDLVAARGLGGYAPLEQPAPSDQNSDQHSAREP